MNTLEQNTRRFLVRVSDGARIEFRDAAVGDVFWTYEHNGQPANSVRPFKVCKAPEQDDSGRWILVNNMEVDAVELTNIPDAQPVDGR
jgi:hypothetical protein